MMLSVLLYLPPGDVRARVTKRCGFGNRVLLHLRRRHQTEMEFTNPIEAPRLHLSKVLGTNMHRLGVPSPTIGSGEEKAVPEILYLVLT